MEEGESKTELKSQSVTAADCKPNSLIGCTDQNGPHKNGLNGLELLMSMTGDMNRNLTAKSSMNSMCSPTCSSGNDIDRDHIRAVNSNRNHASQLLIAAATVVSNGFVSNGLKPYKQNQDSHGHYITTTNSCSNSLNTINGGAFTDGSTRSSTVVSYSSRTSMSTGFATKLSTHTKDLLLTDSVIADKMSIKSKPELVSQGYNSSAKSDAVLSDGTSKSVVVPFLWRRVNENGVVHYQSPSEEILKSLDEAKEYLLSEETCKCGLPCPFHLEKVFNFNPTLDSQPWKLSDVDVHRESTIRPCCHQKHIRSYAVAKECKTVTKSTKPAPSRRRVKLSSQKTSAKRASGGALRRINQQSKESVNPGVEESRVGASMSNAARMSSSSHASTPIPPIETVMRTAQPFYTPPRETGLPSPRHLTDMLSPSMPMLSPHGSTTPGGHMVPVIAHTNYPHPNPGLLAQPPYRHPNEPGILSPGSQSGYYPVMPGLPHGHGGMLPYHQPGYEYMQQAPVRPWNSPPPSHPMPPPGTQFGPPIWHARPEGPTNATRKRRRRASSISSNGGNSDTGYTSGLSSPAHASPGQSKSLEKSEHSLAKSKMADEKKSKAVAESRNDKQSESSGSAALQNNLTSSGGFDVKSNDQLLLQNEMRHTTVIRPPLDHFVDGRMQHPMGQYGAPNGVPFPSYVDPVHRPAQNINRGYGLPPQHQPLPPIYLMDQPPLYPSPHLDRHALRGANPRLSHPNTVLPGITPPQIAVPQTKPGEKSSVDKSKTEQNRTATTASITGNMADKSSVSETKSDDSIKSNAKSTQDAEADNASTKSETNLAYRHAEMMASKHYNQPVIMNGFRPRFNPHMPPNMHYQPGHFNMPRDYPYHPPMHMVRAGNGQLFYRYAQPRMAMPPQAMPYQPGGGTMYHQQAPFMPGHNPPAHYGYSQAPPSPTASPKRKRRKASAKTVIESHSAVLIGTDNIQDVPTVSASLSSTTPADSNGSAGEKAK